MFEPNDSRVLALLKPTDRVLDIGAWARPYRRADYVMDAMPYDTRGYYGSPQGGDHERFTASTWIQRDICSHEPYPFKDKELDFVICSHTLEDIRDPLWVCAEMSRIGKAGYIEIPSRALETCRGIEPGQVGWSHHRWLIDVVDNALLFTMKYHMIHSHWRFSFPSSYRKILPPERQVTFLFWHDELRASERTIHGVEHIATELEAFVDRERPYPALALGVDRMARRAQSLAHRVYGKIDRETRAWRTRTTTGPASTPAPGA